MRAAARHGVIDCRVSRVSHCVCHFRDLGETGAELMGFVGALHMQHHLIPHPRFGRASPKGREKAMGHWRCGPQHVDETRPVGLATGSACASCLVPSRLRALCLECPPCPCIGGKFRLGSGMAYRGRRRPWHQPLAAYRGDSAGPGRISNGRL